MSGVVGLGVGVGVVTLGTDFAMVLQTSTLFQYKDCFSMHRDNPALRPSHHLIQTVYCYSETVQIHFLEETLNSLKLSDAYMGR